MVIHIQNQILNMPTVQELLKNARDEILKAKGYMPEDQKKNQQENAKKILNQSVMFADNVLKRLISITMGRAVSDMFEHVLDTRGSVLMNVTHQDTKKETKYMLTLDIVDSDYMLDLKELKDHPEVKQRITFLLNTVKVLYCPLKDYMKKWVLTDQKQPIRNKNGAFEYSDENVNKQNEKKNTNEEEKSFNYVLQIGLNTTLFLDKDVKKRIGIIMKQVDEFPDKPN